MEQLKSLEAFSFGLTLFLTLSGTARAAEHKVKLPLHGLAEKRLETEVIYDDHPGEADDTRVVKVSWTEGVPVGKGCTLQVASVLNTETLGATARLQWSF